MPEDRTTVERSIWSARPTHLVQATREAIEAWVGMAGTEVLLLDYHQSHLVPFADGEGGTPIPIDAHPAGRAFASSRAVQDDNHLYLPLIVYGERMGVLAVRRPADAPASDDDLAEVAANLARALRLADTATDIYREVRGVNVSPSRPSCSGTCYRAAPPSRPSSAWPGSWSPRTRCPATTSTGRCPTSTSRCR